jgi:hypothetical protein
VAIERVELKDFTVFAEATLELTSGVNVFIGKNSTGKTHAMKAIYAFLRAAALADEPFSASVGHQLREAFKPDDDALGRLGQRRPGQKTFRIRVSSGKKELFAQVYSRDGRITSRVSLGDVPAAVFIPSREALAMHDGFTRAYERRELSFDGTYYNLARELTTAPLRGTRPGALGEVVAELQLILGGKLETRGEKFYLVGPGGARYEAQLMSEGLRKIGSILRLLQNGEIEVGGLLLWDEPETNLNPSVAVKIARILAKLAGAGVQVIVATHDYFVSETLGLLGREPVSPPTRFFSFVRSKDRLSVDVSHADDIDDLPENAIRAESLAHYDRLRGAAP